MMRGSILFRVITSLFLFAPLLGVNQSLAQELPPQATPVQAIETDALEHSTDATPENMKQPAGGRTRSLAPLNEPETISISGTVVDQENVPVADAEIDAYFFGSETGSEFQTTTGSDGSYEFMAAANSVYSVSATKPGVFEGIAYARGNHYLGESSESQNLPPIVLWRFNSIQLSGVITDTNNFPVAGATITCLNCGLGGTEASISQGRATSDNEGRFLTNPSVVNQDPRTEVRLSVEAVDCDGMTREFQIVEGINEVGAIELECGDNYVTALTVSIDSLTFDCSTLEASLSVTSNQSPFFLRAIYFFGPVTGTAFSGTIDTVSGTVPLVDPHNIGRYIPDTIYVLAGPAEGEEAYIGELEPDCEGGLPTPLLEIDNVTLACDGTVTFSVVDVAAIRGDSAAWVTLFNGAFAFDESVRVELLPNVSDYSAQMASSETWPDGALMRAQVSWRAETQANGLNSHSECDVAFETPTATGQPHETPTSTALHDVEIGESSLIVTFVLPDGSDISGAPYSLHAPQATAEFKTEAYLTGVVGPNNSIQIHGLVPGMYKLVVSPDGMTPIETVIQVGEWPLTEALVIVDADGSVKVEYIAQIASTEPANDSSVIGDKVEHTQITNLPETGAGSATDPISIMLILTAAASLVITAGGLVLREKRT